MNKKIAIRLIAGLLTIAALFAGYTWLQDYTLDPDVEQVDTAGMIAAIAYNDSGAQAVVFDASGNEVMSADYVEGKQDRDLVWRPDGQRLFFTSDRTEGFNVYRWNPVRNSVEQRSTGSRSKSEIRFGPPGFAKANEDLLVVLGEAVRELDPKRKRMTQILPMLTKERTEVTDEVSGAAGQLEAMYQGIGHSFKSAAYGLNRDYVYAVMRHEEGEVFVVNPINLLMKDPRGNPNAQPSPMPVKLISGERIEFDVAKDGSAVVAVQGFQIMDAEGEARTMFNLGPESTREQIDAAYRGLLQRANPSQFPAGSPQRAQATEVRGLIDAAYKVLTEGRIVLPYRNAVYKVTVSEAGLPSVDLMVSSKDDSACFMSPKISPDGSQVLLAVTQIKDGLDYDPIQIIVMPNQRGGIAAAKTAIRGDVTEPSWHPSGKSLVFLRAQPNGNRYVMTANLDGTGEKRIGTRDADYSSPSFSPQSK